MSKQAELNKLAEPYGLTVVNVNTIGEINIRLTNARVFVEKSDLSRADRERSLYLVAHYGLYGLSAPELEFIDFGQPDHPPPALSETDKALESWLESWLGRLTSWLEAQ